MFGAEMRRIRFIRFVCALMTREQFVANLALGTKAVRENITRFCWNVLPNGDRYYVILNSSYDGNPLAHEEHLFPDHNAPQPDIRVPQSVEEVTERLWRDGKVPEWIDITPYEVKGDFLYSELRCCGRFANQESLLYHRQEGYPPFHIFGPVQPVGYRGLEQDGKFDLHCYRDRPKST